MAVTLLPTVQSLTGKHSSRFATTWQIERLDGTVLRFTDHNKILTIDGYDYSPLNGLNATARQFNEKLKDSNFEVSTIIDTEQITIEDLKHGKYRDAKVTERIYDWMYPWAGSIYERVYWLTRQKYTGEVWESEAAGLSHWLSARIGRTYSRNCSARLGDDKCKFPAATEAETGTVSEVTSQREFKASGLTKATGYFNFGLIDFGGRIAPAGYTAISTVEELQAIDNDLTGNYALVNDIDASDTVNWNGGAGFSSIGLANTAEFTGNFLGQGWKIKDLFINRPATDYIGLFYRILANDVNLEISGVTIEDCNITGNSNIGALAGQIYVRSGGNINVNECHSSGDITPYAENCGGLIGKMSVGSFDYGGTDYYVQNCSSSVNIATTDNTATRSGGLIGNAAGLAWGGGNTHVRIRYCFATGSINNPNTSIIGGFIGAAGSYLDLNDCYATGDVNAYNYVGGFIGWDSGDTDAVIQRCYSTGAVSAVWGSAEKGGFKGEDGEEATYNDNYYDSDTSGQSDSKGATPKTTTQMKQQATFVNWDFEDTWICVEDTFRPFLYPSGEPGPVNKRLANTGEMMTYVYGSPNSDFVLIEDAPVTLQIGTTFVVYPGCDYKYETCRGKFNNTDNFRGFRTIPGADKAIRTPNAK